jgi:hypothetical protein
MGRVAGDMLDSAALMAAAMKTRRPMGLAAIFALVLPVVIVDVLFAKKLSSQRR